MSDKNSPGGGTGFVGGTEFVETVLTSLAYLFLTTGDWMPASVCGCVCHTSTGIFDERDDWMAESSFLIMRMMTTTSCLFWVVRKQKMLSSYSSGKEACLVP